jgi:hypothetical protein
MEAASMGITKVMPDQSLAATEHAIMQDIMAPVGRASGDPTSLLTDREFPLALRGYDRHAVDAYIQKTSRLIAELQTAHSPEIAVRRALERVGEEVASILGRAHEAAEQITTRSRLEAENRLQAAHREARKITVEAKRQLVELDADTDRIWEERARFVEETSELAAQLVGIAEEAAERFEVTEQSDPEQNGTPETETLVDPRDAEGIIDGQREKAHAGSARQSASSSRQARETDQDSTAAFQAFEPSDERLQDRELEDPA